MVAVADIAQEVRLEATVGKERLVDLGVVEAAHGPDIEPHGAGGDDQPGALQGSVAERGVERHLLVARSGEPALSGWIVREDPRQMLMEARVVGHDRCHRRLHGLGGVAAGERRPQLLLAFLGAHEHKARRLGVGRCRPPPQHFVEFANLHIGHRLVLEAVMGARLAQDFVDRLAVQHRWIPSKLGGP